VSRPVTVLTDPFTSPTAPFLSECQNGGTILPIANLTTDSESGSLDSYSNFLVRIRLSRLVLEIFTCDREMDGQRGPLL